MLRLIEQASISFLPGAPTIFQSLLQHPDRMRSTRAPALRGDGSGLGARTTGEGHEAQARLRGGVHRLWPHRVNRRGVALPTGR